MSIRYLKDKKQFVINTKNTTYAFEIVKDRYLGHIYYGKRKKDFSFATPAVVAFGPYIEELFKIILLRALSRNIPSTARVISEPVLCACAEQTEAE